MWIIKVNCPCNSFYLEALTPPEMHKPSCFYSGMQISVKCLWLECGNKDLQQFTLWLFCVCFWGLMLSYLLKFKRDIYENIINNLCLKFCEGLMVCWKFFLALSWWVKLKNLRLVGRAAFCPYVWSENTARFSVKSVKTRNGLWSIHFNPKFGFHVVI